jgi:hypothetical protein
MSIFPLIKQLFIFSTMEIKFNLINIILTQIED